MMINTVDNNMDSLFSKSCINHFKLKLNPQRGVGHATLSSMVKYHQTTKVQE